MTNELLIDAIVRQTTEALGALAALRQRLSALRTKIAAANVGRPVPERRSQVIVYCGQNVIEVGDEEES